MHEAHQQRVRRPVEAEEGQRPAAEEQRRHHRRAGEHVRVFADEEHAELHRAVFRVVAADEFGLRLRHVEGQAVRFREGGDEENHEGDDAARDEQERLRAEATAENREGVPAVLRLVLDDFAEVQVADDEEHRDDAHAHRDFVGNHLRAGTDAAEEGELRIRRVASQHDAIHAERHDAEGVEDADVQVRDDHLLRAERGAERNHRHDEERRHERDGRCEPEVNLPHMRRGEVFLDEALHAVHQRMPESELGEERTEDRDAADEREVHAVRPDAVLNERRDLALRQHRVGDERQQRPQHARNLQQREEHELRLRTQ